MSSELSKVQVEYISEDKIIKVKRGGFGVRVLLCNRLDANGPRSRVSVGAGGGRGERGPGRVGPVRPHAGGCDRFVSYSLAEIASTSSFKNIYYSSSPLSKTLFVSKCQFDARICYTSTAITRTLIIDLT